LNNGQTPLKKKTEKITEAEHRLKITEAKLMWMLLIKQEIILNMRSLTNKTANIEFKDLSFLQKS